MKDSTRNARLRSYSKSAARIAVIAALYAALTFAALPIAYGMIQLRVSEALTILPLFCWEAIPGLFIGCLIANSIVSIMDVILGSLATLLAAVLTRLLKKIYLGIIPPIVLNALVVPIIILTYPDIVDPYWFMVLTVGAGQLIVICALGIPLYFALKRPNINRVLFGNVKHIKKTETELDAINVDQSPSNLNEIQSDENTD